MARKAEPEFPKWKPLKQTMDTIRENWSTGSIYDPVLRKKLYKAIRNSSSAFIAKPSVREFILKRDGYKCVQCSSQEHLQIDHINSVHSCFKGKTTYLAINIESNLQTLCRSCNSSKTP